MSVSSFVGCESRCLQQQVAIENPAEMGGEALADLLQRGGDAVLGHGGDWLGEAAGDDVLEIGEVGVDVEGEAVGSYPAAEVDSDGGDFAVADPDAGEFGDAAGVDAVFAEGVDDGLFEGADVGADVALPVAE